MTDENADVPTTSFNAADARSATADASIPVSRFDAAYESGVPPWDIDGPQPAFARLVAAGEIAGSVLDLGCGTGEHALHFAANGLQVLGVDASGVAVRRASEKAAERGLGARFAEADVQELADLGETFDTITDSGCLHTLSDDAMRAAIRGAHAVLRPGGTYWLMCFNEHAVGPGPRRITQDDIARLFADGWAVRSIEPAEFQLVNATGFKASAWLARIERV